MSFKKWIAILLTLCMLLPLCGFSLPSGAEGENLALGKAVCAPGSGQSNINDGSISNYWDGGAAPGDAIIDLDGYYKLSSICVVPYHSDSRYYHFSVWISTDGIHYDKVGEKYDTQRGTDAGFTYAVNNLTARYVKITMTYNSANFAIHLNEVMVYGVEDPDFSYTPDYTVSDPDDPGNLAYGKPTRANSASGFAMVAVDGDPSTVWNGEDYPKYVDVDLMANYDLTSVKVYLPVTEYKITYAVYGSTDGVSYDELARPTEIPTAAGHTFPLENACYRILRVCILRNGAGAYSGSSIGEIKAYGSLSDTPVTPTRTSLSFTDYGEWLSESYGIEVGDDFDIADTFTGTDTVTALEGLVTRILGNEYVDWFTFSITDNAAANGKDYYRISDGADGKILIEGNEGVSIAAGLNYYLKYFCNVHISQQTKQVNMPESIPAVGSPILTVSPYEIRYAYNYCTLSYTMAFYGYDDWQRELDYLALSGVNLILDTTATEALWVAYLQQYGYTVDQAKDFVCGYAYKAWWLMGNLSNYGGTVSDQWIYDTLEMARVNQRYMTVLGMQPCLQGFMGALPTDFGRVAAESLAAKGFSPIFDYLVPQGDWAGYEQPILMKTTYDGYETMAADFYATQTALYGPVTDYYAGDLAHEGGVLPADLSKAEMSATILEYMMGADQNAVWILQAWQGNPQPAILSGFGANRADHVIVLDLNATCSSNYGNTTYWGGREFGGTGWVYCMLDNYGGRPGVHGELVGMMNSILSANSTSSHMKGIGLTSEGTQMNPVCQELLWEMAWRSSSFDMNDWLHAYATRRYGAESDSADAAWDLLLQTAYGYTGNHSFNTNSLVNMLPSFSPTAISGTYPLTYDPELFEQAAALLMEDFETLKGSECYIYDLVDVFKQLLSNTMVTYFDTLCAAYNADQYAIFRTYKDKFLAAIELMDEVCSYEKDSTIARWVGRVDNWVNDARTGDYDDYTVELMKINAKALITTWGTKALHTYAYRQYSGQLMDYNYAMWQSFLTQLDTNMVNGGTATPAASVYYMQAWDSIVDHKEYSDEIPAADGLTAIWEEIVENHLFAQTADVVITNDNIASLGTAYAKTEKTGTNPASSVNDNKPATLWIPTSNAVPTYVGIKFAQKYSVYQLRVVAETRPTLGTNVMNYYVEAKIDGVYQTVYTGQTYNEEKQSYTTVIPLDEPILTDDIRVNFTSNGGIWPALAELKVYAENKIAANGGYTIEDGVLTGVESGTNVTSLLRALLCKEGTLTVCDATGNAKTAANPVAEGDSVLLTLNGVVVDRLTIGTLLAAPTATLAVSSENATAGETVTVAISLPENPGIKKYAFVLDYDTSALTYLGCTTTLAKSPRVLTPAGYGRSFQCTNTAAFTSTEPFLFVTFEVSADAVGRDLTVTPVLRESDSLNIVGSDGTYKPVNTTCVAGTIHVAGGTVTVTGDVNGDGTVSIRDVSELLAILASGENQTPICDLNGDGTVSIRDVSELLALIANS